MTSRGSLQQGLLDDSHELDMFAGFADFVG